jgi:hypothetical protein
MVSNPLASAGYSNRDYAAAVAALASEALNQGYAGMAAVADVAKNRLDAARFSGANYGQKTKDPSLADMLNGQFDGMSTKIGREAARAALTGKSIPGVPADVRKTIDAALVDTLVTGKMAGITQGATDYATAKAFASSGYHSSLGNQYGALTIGDHVFTGPGLRDQPFDPANLGMSPPGAPAELSGLTPPAVNVGVPDGQTPRRPPREGKPRQAGG